MPVVASPRSRFPEPRPPERRRVGVVVLLPPAERDALVQAASALGVPFVRLLPVLARIGARQVRETVAELRRQARQDGVEPTVGRLADALARAGFPAP